MSEAGQLARADGFDAGQLARLAQEYEREPTPARRKPLAFGFAWLDLPEEAQRVLAPQWGRDLDQDEMLLLLWLDHRLGEQERMAELARSMNHEDSVEFDSFRWSLAALSMLGEERSDCEMQTGFARFHIRKRSMSLGGQWGIWAVRQLALIQDRSGTGRHGGILVDLRGRTYHLTGAGTGISKSPKGN